MMRAMQWGWLPIRVFFLGAALLCISAGQSSTPSFEEGGSGWKMVSLDLDVVAEPGVFTVVAHARMKAEDAGSHGPNLILRRGEMRFDAVKGPSGTIGAIQPSGAGASIRFPNVVPVGTEIGVEVRCSRLPRAGRRTGANADGAFASWGGGGVWYPLPASGPGPYRNGDAPGSTTLTVPSGWQTLSSGRKVSSTAREDRRVDTWKVQDDLGRGFVAAPFKVQTAMRRGREISALFIEDAPEKAREYIRLAGDVVDALEPKFGPFPFGNYAIAALPTSLAPPGFVGRAEPGYFLGHANTIAADRPNIPLIAHEMSHSWWAIQVRCGGQGNQLLEEGMAQYAAALFTESRSGAAVAARHLRLNNVYPAQMAYASARGYFHLWRTGQDNAFLPGVDGSLIPYAKGAWIYHMLRHRVGDAAFFSILKRLVRKYRGGSLTFADLRQAFEAHDSRLKTFFAESCERAGAPVLDVSWNRSGHGAEVTIRQLGSTYHMPIEIAVDGTEGTSLQRVELRDAVQTFTLGSSGLATGVRLDPEDKLLLWKPEYGPIPNVTPPMSEKAWRSWFDEEVRWILSVYTDVPGMSIAVRSRDRSWSRGYGASVRDDTLFQAGQLSQLVSATVALKAGLDLNQSVWQTPSVTLRQLLSQTTPLTLTGALSVEAGKPRPNLDEMLGRVTASSQSGSHQPSAANYLVLQKLVGDPFDRVAASAVLGPFQMRRSTYSPLPGTYAIGHESDGHAVTGGYRVYPEAGQGLWTTAPEFAHFVSEVMKDKALFDKIASGDQDASSYLGPAKAGLGVLVQGKWIHQVGLNVGYTALVIANPETGDVFVALANDSDRALVPLIDLAQRVGLRYRWSMIPRFN